MQREPFDEALGASLAADQRELLAEAAAADHPEHDHTDAQRCPTCYDEGGEPTITVCHVREPYDIYGGRGRQAAHLLNTPVGQRGWLGNPYRLDDHDRDTAVAKYARAFLGRLRTTEFSDAVEDLRGQRVACWCRRSDEAEPRCHLDVVRAFLADGEAAVARFLDDGGVGP